MSEEYIVRTCILKSDPFNEGFGLYTIRLLKAIKPFMSGDP